MTHTLEQPKKNTYSRISKYLFLIFILFTAFIIIGSIIVYQSFKKNLHNEISQQLSAISELKVSQLTQWRKERLGDANVFYKNKVFTDLVKRYMKSHADADAKMKIQAWLGQIAAAYTYNRICLHDSAGTEHISFPESKIHASLIFSKRSAEVLKSGKVEFQDLYRDENDKKIWLTIFVPILDELDNGKKLGLIALRIDPMQYLYPMIEKWPTSSRTSETLIIRRDGNDVLFLNNVRFIIDAALNLRIPLDRKDVLAVKAVLGAEGTVEGIDYRGKQVIGYLSTVPESPWIIIARMDTEEAFAPLNDRLSQIIILAVALLFCGGTGVGFIFRYQQNLYYKEQIQLGEKIKISELRYRRLFEAARDGILILNAETGMVVDVNPYLIELLGLTKEVFLDRKVWELGFLNDAIANEDNFKELKEKGYVRYEDMAMEDHKGERHEVEFVSNVYMVDNKKVIQCNIRDISERKLAEEKLRKKDVEFKKLSSNAPGMIFQFTKRLDGTFFVPITSEGIREIYGCSPEDVVADFSPIAKVILPEDLERVVRDIEYSAAHLTLFNCEYRVQLTGKPIKWLMSSSTPEKLDDGTITWYGFNSDITERKHAEMEKIKDDELLIQKEALLQSIINNSTSLIYVVDAEGRFLLVNQALASLFSISRERLVGQTREVAIPKEIAEQHWKNDLEVMKSRKVKIIDEQNQEHDGMHTYLTIKYPLFNSAGGVYAIGGMSTDITDRKRVEERLKLSEERYRFALETTSQIGWSTPPDGVVEDMPMWRKYSGQSLDEVVGWKWLDAIHPDDRESAYKAWSSAAAQKCDYFTEYRIRRADGVYRNFMVRGIPLLNADGSCKEWVGTCIDITDRKQIEEKINKLNSELETRVIERTSQLELSNKELTAFSYSVSHDLRAPLRSIDGFSLALLEDYAPKLDEQGKDNLQRIRVATQRMGRLIDDLLSLSRVSQLELIRKSVNLSNIIQEIANQLQKSDPGRDVEFAISPDVTASGDKELLNIVLTNLMQNAFKFTSRHAKARIEFGMTAHNGTRTYFVRDDGAGYDMQFADKMFGAFQRMHSTVEFSGTGIGLATVYRIINRHGGKVWAESEVEKGATFYFTLS